MTKAPLWIPLILAVFAFLFSTIFFPSLPLFYFAPFLAFAFQRLPLQKSLWAAALCGLSYDLLSFSTRLGLYSFLIVVCACICLRFKRWFFEERLLSIPLYTALISFIFVLLQCLFLKYPVSFLLFIPFLDMLYAFFWFTCPILLYNFLLARKVA